MRWECGKASRHVPCFRLVSLVPLLAFAMTAGSFVVGADEQKSGQRKEAAGATAPAEAAKAQADDELNSPVVVDLQDGAASPDAALAAYVAASDAGDDEAALLMVDPPTRRLFALEMAMERYAIHSTILERAIFGERQFEVGGMLFLSAGRDLVRVRSIKQLAKRVVDENRVVFTVLTTEKSYHDDGDIHNVREYLAIRRSGKWYIFRPFGLLSMVLREPGFAGVSEDQPPFLRVKRNSEETPNREDADFEVEYLVPLEVIHEHLVQLADDPGIEQCQQLAEKINRYFTSVGNRAIRDDYANRAELSKALAPVEDWFDELHDKWGDALSLKISELAKHATSLPDASKGKPKGK